MKISLLCYGILLLVFTVKPYSNLYGQKKNKESELYLRAPSVVPGTLPEMRQASYWISRLEQPENLLLTISEIKSRNLAFEQRMSERSELDSSLNKKIDIQLKSRPGLLTHLPNLDTKSPDEVRNLTKQMIKRTTDYLRSREFGNILAIAYSIDELNEIEMEISFDSLKNIAPPLEAIVTTQSRLYIVPPVKPEYKGLFTKGKARWDLWCLDVLPIGTPVQILYTSRSGSFTFVVTKRGYGWIPSEEIAIDFKEIRSVTEKGDNFIICTGDRVPYYTDSECSLVSGWLRMGDRLNLTEGAAREVLVPLRFLNGELSYQKAWLKPDADVCVGFLPYTQKNVGIQAFKLLDNLYDWTGTWYGRNHATNIRDIFSCFGFELPSDGILITAYSEKLITVDPREGIEAQLKSINSNKPLITIQVCENSHSQLYLGNYDGMPIGFDAHGYSYLDSDGNDLELKRWVVGTIEMPEYFLKQEITFVRMY